jgi:hypothetical protein
VTIGIALSAWLGSAGAAWGWTHETIAAPPRDHHVLMVTVSVDEGEAWFAYAVRDAVDADPHALYLRQWSARGWSEPWLVSRSYTGIPDESYRPSLRVVDDYVLLATRRWTGNHELVELVYDRREERLERLAVDRWPENATWGLAKGLHTLAAYHDGHEERVRSCARVSTPGFDDEVTCGERSLHDVSPSAYRDPRIWVTHGQPRAQDHVTVAFSGERPILGYASVVSGDDGAHFREVRVAWEASGVLEVVSGQGGDRPSIAVDDATVVLAWDEPDREGVRQVRVASCVADPTACAGSWERQSVSFGPLDATWPALLAVDGEQYVAFDQGGLVKVASRCAGDPVWRIEVVDGTRGVEALGAAKSALAADSTHVHLVYRVGTGRRSMAQWSKKPRRSCL